MESINDNYIFTLIELSNAIILLNTLQILIHAVHVHNLQDFQSQFKFNYKIIN